MSPPLLRRLAIGLPLTALALGVVALVAVGHLPAGSPARRHLGAAPSAIAGFLRIALKAGEGLGAATLALGIVSACGHLSARRLRRPGPSRLPHALGGWVEARRGELAPRMVELVLGRENATSPYEVARLFDGLAGILRPRWYRRLALGPDPLVLRILNDPAARTVRFALAARTDRLGAIEHRLRATYPDARLRPLPHPVLPAGPLEVVRLKKARRWLWALQSTKDFEHSPVEALVATLAGSGVSAQVELVATPVPSFLEQFAARALRTQEQRLNAETQASPTAPGIESAVAQKTLKGALEGVGRALFFFDLRIAVPAGHLARALELAGIAQETRADNHLRPRVMRVRRRLYAARVRLGIPPVLPGLWTQRISSTELASLWHLPSLRLKGVGLERAGSRQLAAGPALSRDVEHQLLRDELGPVGLRPEDLRYGLGVLGAAGGGKSALLLRLILNIARDPTRALIVIDPKEDLARDALAGIPADRTVHVLDLAHPHVGLNPLTALRSADVPAEVVADLVIAALSETFGEGAIGPRSDQFLRTAIQAVCLTDPRPSLTQVHRMLDPHDADYRDWVLDRLAALEEADFVRDFWGRRFPALQKANPRFVAEALEAPLNKLSRFLGVPSLQLLVDHPVELDLPGIVKNREILVLNGAKGAVGETNAVLVCQLLVLLIQKLLHQQQRRPREQRTQTTLVIDEAHNLLTPSFATMLSEGRAGGLECVAALQYTAQIQDDRIRAGVKSLLQNLTVFRLRELEDARAAAALAMEVYADAIRSESEDQRRLRLDPVDVLNLPSWRCLNLWLADGRPQPAFTATTLPIEPTRCELGPRRLDEHHRAAQARRGFHPHEHGQPIRASHVWSSTQPIQVVDCRLYLDIGAWRQIPDSIDELWATLTSRDSVEIEQRALGLDPCRELWEVNLASWLAVGLLTANRPYAVTVTARQDGHESTWTPRGRASANDASNSVVVFSKLPSAASGWR